MEFLRKLFVQTQSHLQGLTVSQRLAIGTSVALIAVALLGLVNWASAPERVPLLDQLMTADEVAQIQQRLDAMDVEYQLKGDLIMVPAASRRRLLARLSEGNLLPQDLSNGFANLLEQSTPWLSQDAQKFRRSVALSNELSAVLREFDGVTDARVFIDKTILRRIGQPSVTPTASVWVKLSPGQALGKHRVRGFASFVSRSIGGMNLSDVGIVDASTGRSYSVPKPENGQAYDDLEDRQLKESHFANKIKTLLGYIPGVLVAVTADLSPESLTKTESKIAKPYMSEETAESTLQDRTTPAAEPGVNPNLGAAIASGGNSDRMEKEKSTASYQAPAGSVTTLTEKPRHELLGLSASVIVPRSYLAAVYARENDGKEPTDAELEAASRKPDSGVLAKIEQQVVSALALDDPGQVRVDWFPDDATVLMGSASVEASTGAGMMAYVRSYGSKAGLAGLAVMSLMMMVMMVRKVGEGPILPGEESPPGLFAGKQTAAAGAGVAPMQTLEGMPVGEARASEQALEGLEVDEETLKSQHIVEQISSMVNEDPEASVNILQQWIDQSQA